jgi:hypothetical protein
MQTPQSTGAALDEGVHVVAGHNPDSAKPSRAPRKRTMPV